MAPADSGRTNKRTKRKKTGVSDESHLSLVRASFFEKGKTAYKWLICDGHTNLIDRVITAANGHRPSSRLWNATERV